MHVIGRVGGDELDLSAGALHLKLAVSELHEAREHGLVELV
jgi:hypothetical protein